MEIDDIYLIDRQSLCEFLAVNNVSIEEIGEIRNCKEDLQNLAISILLSSDLIMIKINELRNIFNIDENSIELLNVLVDSNGQRITIELINQIQELSCLQSNSKPLDVNEICINYHNRSNFKGILAELPEVVMHNCSAFVITDCPSTQINYAGRLKLRCVSQNICKVVVCATRLTGFGYYELSHLFQNSVVSIGDGRISEVIGNTLCTSRTYEYATCLDTFLDRLYWGWGDEGHWTDLLESSLLELLIGIDENLEDILTNMGHRTESAFAGDIITETYNLFHSLKYDISSALCEHTSLSIGKLHQSFLQILDCSSMNMHMMKIPMSFISAIHRFLIAKINSTSYESFIVGISRLLHAAQRYLEYLPEPVSSDHYLLENFIRTFSGICNQSESNVLQFSDEQIQLLHSLRPRPIDIFNQQVNEIGTVPSLRVCYYPTLPLEVMTNSSELDRYAAFYSESLIMDIIWVGSMFFKMHDSTQSIYLISQLLESGFAYVASASGSIMALLNTERSMLQLLNEDGTFATLPSRILKRGKDLRRSLRNHSVGSNSQISLRINSNFDLALEKLRAHHGDDCWVGQHLEKVWRLMLESKPMKLIIFELWIGNNLVAADFGHPAMSGKTFYVATRFFDRSILSSKQIQPGFLLAFAECKVLRELGCMWWDLGGVDLNPRMRYKLEVAGDPKQRPIALELLLRARHSSHTSNMSNLTSDMWLVNNLKFENLIS